MNYFVLWVLIFLSAESLSQARVRKFSNVINHPAINTYAPYISMDGKSLIYLSDNSEDRALILFYTKKKDAVNWDEPEAIPKHIINGRLAFLGGVALNENGETLFFTSLKGGGLGGFDIYFTTKQGTTWTRPKNIGLPINSRGHEGAPSISSDGSTLYFMRCENMNQKKAEGCSIFVSKKTRMGKWKEPVPLPDFINTGNSQAPRILADNETLLFASDKLPKNKGKMDLYVTRLKEAAWTKPVPLDFANTADEDQYASASGLGRYLLKSQAGQRTHEIVELLFPKELKPKSCTRLKIVIKKEEGTAYPYINIFEYSKKKKIHSGYPDEKGTFITYLQEGGYYEVAVEPIQANYTFYSKIYDLAKGKVKTSDYLEVELMPVSTTTQIALEGITFEPHRATIDIASNEDLRRLVRMIKSNPEYVFEIEVTFDGYQHDSIQSDPNLTEQMIDTVHLSITKQVGENMHTESSSHHGKNNSIYLKDQRDSLLLVKGDIDSHKHQITIDSMVINTIYHNDRTARQAQAIVNYLQDKGIAPNRLYLSHNVTNDALIKNRKPRTQVKVRVR